VLVGLHAAAHLQQQQQRHISSASAHVLYPVLTAASCRPRKGV
jgi:hypothetical protein